MEAGYICNTAATPSTCSLSPSGSTRSSDTDNNLLFQTNFNYGIFDISTSHKSFTLEDGYDISSCSVTNDAKSGYCNFGASGYISAEAPAVTTAVTVCAWLRPSALTASTAIYYRSGAKHLSIGLSGGKFAFGNGDSILLSATGTPVVNTWYHVCASISNTGDTIIYHVDVETDSDTFTAAAAHADALNIGADKDGSNVWNGDIFDVRVYAAVWNGAYKDATTSNKAAYNKVTPGCGDGVLDTAEECDDNNFNDGDGCDKFCKKESQYACTGSPSICYKTGANFNEYTVEGSTEADLVFPPSNPSDSYRPAGAALDFAGSVVKSIISALDKSKLGSWAPTVTKSRIGEFTYTLHGLNPSGSYKLDFVFAETEFSVVGKRVFKVSVQGEQPSWSPVDIIAAAGKKNTAIGRSVTVVADAAGVIVVSFTGNAIVQAFRYSAVSYQVAAFTGSSVDVLTVEGSASGSGVFNPAKGYPSFSIEAFVYADSLAASFTVVGKGASEFGLAYDSTNDNFVCTFGSATLASTAGVFAAKKWYHVACTKDAGTARIYINGAEDTKAAASGGWTHTTTPLTFGSGLQGYLDSVRLWERALTPNEIFANAFSNAHTVSYYGLVEEWTFDSPQASYSAFGTLGQASTAAKYPAGTKNWFDHATPAITVAIDIGSSTSVFDSNIVYHPDSFFTGGSMVSSDSSDPIGTPGSFPDDVLKTGRAGGEFTYNIRGLVPQQSYLLDLALVEYTAEADYDLWIQGVKVSVQQAPIDETVSFSYTILADFAGNVIIKAGDGASLSAIVLTPQAAPVGSVRFFTVANSAPAKLSYEATLSTPLGGSNVAYSALEDTNTLLNAPTTAGAYKSISTSTPFSAAKAISATTAFTIDKLIPGEIYHVQVFLLGADSGNGHTVSSQTDSQNTVGLVSTISKSTSSVIFTDVADAGGEIAVEFEPSGSLRVSAVQVLEGPRVLISKEINIPQGSKTLTVAGANFNLLVVLGDNAVSKSTLSSVNPVSVYPYFNSLVFDLTGTTLSPGPVALSLAVNKIGGSTWLIPPTKALGEVKSAPTITENEKNLFASNTKRLVISGTNLPDDVSILLAASELSPASTIACKVNVVSTDKIICTPASTLPNGKLYAFVSTFGQKSTTGIQIGVVVHPPSISSVARVYADSSTLVINGAHFHASPNHRQNNVVISQQGSNRKRSVSGGRDLLSTVAPSCAIITATTTQITCALSGVVAGPISVSVGSSGGFSAAQVVTVHSAMTGSCIPPRGAPDAADSSLCNCWSGYAPSSSAFADCSVNPTCLRTNVDPSSNGPAMSKPTTSFASDRLVIKQTSPIVGNRRDTVIRFLTPAVVPGGHTPVTAVLGAPGSPQCGYPGNLWTKTVEGCLDTYTAYIPWPVHTLCGFVQLNSSTTSALFQAQMDTTYVTANLINGAYTQRVTTDSYIVSVKFAKSLSFSATFNAEFAESTANDFVNVLVDATVFEPTSRILTVYLTVESSWPYMIDASQLVTGAYTPATGIDAKPADVSANVTANADSTISDVISCTTQTNSLCGQMLIAKILIKNATICDIAGGYKFDNTPLFCRDSGLGVACGSSQPTTNLYFEIDSTNLCNEDAVNPSASMDPVLTAYTDASMTKPQTTFYSNDLAYFTISVVSPFTTVDSLVLHQLNVSNVDAGVDEIYNNDGGSGPYEQILTIAFVAHDNHTMTPPGSPISVSFGFILSPDSLTNTLHILRESTTATSPLEISVSVNINFHGNNNKKRSLSNNAASEFASETSSTTVTAKHKIQFYHTERPPEMMERPLQSEIDTEPQNAINNEVPSKNIWADLLNTPKSQTELDDWFDTLQSGADTLLVKSSLLVIFLGCLLVHIIA